MRKALRTFLVEERKRRKWSQQEVANVLGTTQHNVSRWERGQTFPGLYFRTKLCALFGKSAQELGLLEQTGLSQQCASNSIARDLNATSSIPAHTIPFWYVSYPRNSFFTGREEFLHDLHTVFQKETSTALPQSWAITGLGGIGKTQIALEYAYRYRPEYASVFWVNATTYETLMDDVQKMAELLQLPEKERHDHQKLLWVIQRWLATHQEWLLILDDANDMAMIQSVLPTEFSGHLLLTTRVQALGSLAQCIEVGSMGMTEGITFLLRRAKLLALDETLDRVPKELLAEAEAIVMALDSLPLALDQAGVYIEETGCHLADYLDLYRLHHKDLLQRRGHTTTYHPESVAATWLLSFQKIEQVNPIAADLLRLCAFLDGTTIPEELLTAGNIPPGVALQPIARDAFSLNKAIEELRKFSLVQRIPNTRSLRISRLVQTVIKDSMDNNMQRQWAERAVKLTNLVLCRIPETAQFQ